MPRGLIYGANGYTGALIVEQAVAMGLRPTLAGRSGTAVRALAGRHGLEARVFALDEPEAVLAGVDGSGAVLNAAGPFSSTATPLVEACLATGTHYCDITGEIDVFEGLAARDAAAIEAGVTILPGVGFDVVPSDCLLAHVAGRIENATRLRISIGGSAQISRGTARTIIEMAHTGTAVLEEGRIRRLAETPFAEADFGRGRVPVMGVSYGDVSTARHSTGASDVAAFVEVPAVFARGRRLLGAISSFVGTPLVQSTLKNVVDHVMPAGPSSKRRGGSGMVVLAEAWNADGGHAAARLTTPEVYGFTARSAADALSRILNGGIAAGFLTPSRAFGADHVLLFDGTTREDL